MKHFRSPLYLVFPLLSSFLIFNSANAIDAPTLVKDIKTVRNQAYNDRGVVVNGQFFFVGDSAAAGFELWKTNGTKAGTSLVKDIRTGTQSSNIRELTKTTIGGTEVLFFIANDGT